MFVTWVSLFVHNDNYFNFFLAEIKINVLYYLGFITETFFIPFFLQCIIIDVQFIMLQAICIWSAIIKASSSYRTHANYFDQHAPQLITCSISPPSEPRPPSGFRIINQEYISVNATLVTLAWDPPPGQTVDYYILVIDPDTRTKTDYLFESPITVELKPYRFHAATLIAANCIGESTSAALEVGKKVCTCSNYIFRGVCIHWTGLLYSMVGSTSF